jgi:hypothetical protein
LQTRGDAYDTRRPVYRHPLFVQESELPVRHRDRDLLDLFFGWEPLVDEVFREETFRIPRSG